MWTEKLMIGVIGMGDTGLPVATDFATKYPVSYYDLEKEFDKDFESEITLYHAQGGATIEVIEDPGSFSRVSVLLVAIPVTISISKQPDLGLLIRACEVAGRHMRKGTVVIIVSSVYPGVTEEKCVTVLEQYSGLEAGKQFFIGFSPDGREGQSGSPGASKSRIIIAGQNTSVLDYIAGIYETVYGQGIYKAESIRVAEAAELVGTIQQTVNIALMNELAIIFNSMNVDTQDVLRVAAMKKDFLKFSPGLTGNHEKSEDSYQLIYRALAAGQYPEIILSALQTNDGIGRFIANSIIKEMNQFTLPLQSSIITVIGITNKEDSPILEKSKVFDMIEELQEFGLRIQVTDNLADPKLVEMNFGIQLIAWSELEPSDAVIVAVPHKEVRDAGWKTIRTLLKDETSLVFDIKSVLDKKNKPEKIELWRF